MRPFGSQRGSIFNRHRRFPYYGQALTGSKEKWGALETGLHLGTPPAPQEEIKKRPSPRIDFSRDEILPDPIPPGATPTRPVSSRTNGPRRRRSSISRLVTDSIEPRIRGGAPEGSLARLKALLFPASMRARPFFPNLEGFPFPQGLRLALMICHGRPSG